MQIIQAPARCVSGIPANRAGAGWSATHNGNGWFNWPANAPGDTIYRGWIGARNRLKNLAFIYVVLIFNACGNAGIDSRTTSARAPLNVEELLQQLKAIENGARLASDESSNWPYFKNPNVRILYSNPALHQRASTELWNAEGVPFKIKALSVRLLQCLPLSDYLTLVRSSFVAYKAGQVPAELVETLINPGPDWGTQVALSYQDLAVSTLLKEIASDPASTAGIRGRISEILSGESAGYILAYNLPSEPLPRLSCSAK